jgi:hypothetical protein
LKLFSFKRKIYWRFLTHICIKFIRPRPRRAHQGLNQSAQRRCRQIGAVFSQSPAAVGVRVEELHRNRERGTVLLLRGPSRRALGGDEWCAVAAEAKIQFLEKCRGRRGSARRRCEGHLAAPGEQQRRQRRGQGEVIAHLFLLCEASLATAVRWGLSAK